MAKIERQVRRYKEKIRHHKAREGLSEMAVYYHVLEPPAHEAPPHHDEAAPSPPPRKPPVISKTDKLTAQALHVEEAVMQLDLLSQPFLLFRNVDSGQIAVVYRRDDGGYGLIETSPPQ